MKILATVTAFLVLYGSPVSGDDKPIFKGYNNKGLHVFEFKGQLRTCVVAQPEIAICRSEVNVWYQCTAIEEHEGYFKDCKIIPEPEGPIG